jgi:hypothetical protein
MDRLADMMFGNGKTVAFFATGAIAGGAAFTLAIAVSGALALAGAVSWSAALGGAVGCGIGTSQK